MMGMAVQTLYSVVDMIFVGRISGLAIAALGFNVPLFWLAMGISFGLGTGVTAVIARFMGARDQKSQRMLPSTEFFWDSYHGCTVFTYRDVVC